MKLTPAKELSKGFWFVRRIIGEEDLGRDPWAIGVLYGHHPFLYGRTIAYSNEISKEDRLNRALENRYYDITDPNEWEFGEKIEFPTED